MKTTTTTTFQYDDTGRVLSQTVVEDRDSDAGNQQLAADAAALGISEPQARALADKFFPLP